MSTIIRQFVSERGMPLVFWCEGRGPRSVPVLTVENYCKWYSLYLVKPDGSVARVGVPEAQDAPDGESECADHVPNPNAVWRMARRLEADVDTQAMEMIVGRWEMETRERYWEDDQ